MSEAEEKFRAVVRQALQDQADSQIYNTAEDYTNAVVGSLKLDNWFINNGAVREIAEADWTDYEDNYTQYTVWVTGGFSDE